MVSLRCRSISKIDRLSQLLEDADNTAIEGRAGTAKGTGKKTLKIMLFQLEQRVDELDRKVEEVRSITDDLGEDARGDLMLKSVGVATSSKSTIPAPPGQQHAEPNGLRGLITKQEMYINDINLRLTDLENGMHKLEPNNIRALIRDIAELALHKETQEVVAAMDSIKGSQKHHGMLVEQLKEELKSMDDRFKQDIDKKIERHDLYTTKNQLRHKVRRCTIIRFIAPRTRAEAEGEVRVGGRVRIADQRGRAAHDALQLQVLLLQPGG